MNFSEHQVWMIRKRLRAYREQEGRRLGLKRGLPWKAFSSKIEKRLDLSFELPPERLRQFVQGVSGKKIADEAYFPNLEQNRLNAVYEFLCKHEIGFLSEQEMRHLDAAVPVAAISLAETFPASSEKNKFIDLMEGLYETTQTNKHYITKYSVSLTQHGVRGLFRADETTTKYKNTGKSDDPIGWTVGLRRQAFVCSKKRTGWLVVLSLPRSFGVFERPYEESQSIDLVGFYTTPENRRILIAKCRTAYSSEIHPEWNDMIFSEKDEYGRNMMLMFASSRGG